MYWVTFSASQLECHIEPSSGSLPKSFVEFLRAAHVRVVTFFKQAAINYAPAQVHSPDTATGSGQRTMDSG